MGTQFIHLLTIAAEHLFSAMHRSGTCTIIQACVSSFVESKHSGPYERHVWTCHWLAYGNHSRASILLLFRDGAKDLSVFGLLLCLVGQYILDILEYRSLVSPAQLAVFFRGFSFFRRLSFYGTITASLVVVAGLACDAR